MNGSSWLRACPGISFASTTISHATLHILCVVWHGIVKPSVWHSLRGAVIGFPVEGHFLFPCVSVFSFCHNVALFLVFLP